jgi:hypothetical protein
MKYLVLLFSLLVSVPALSADPVVPPDHYSVCRDIIDPPKICFRGGSYENVANQMLDYLKAEYSAMCATPAYAPYPAGWCLAEFVPDSYAYIGLHMDASWGYGGHRGRIYKFFVKKSGFYGELVIEAICSDGSVILDYPGYSCPSACPIQPLPPITDPIVLLFENNPNRSDTTCLAPAMSTALSCLLTAVTNAGGNPSVGSACRPVAYNQHLGNVWDKWHDELLRNNNPACAALRTEVQAHFNRHGMVRRPARNSLHSSGQAVDVTIKLPSAQIDVLAAQCQLRRPDPVGDRVHFSHK